MSVFRPNASALLTGGASGIGLAVAQLCLRHDMKVTIVDFNQTTLDFAIQNLKKEVKGEVKCVKADVGDKEAWKKLREEVGDVDFLMLNAGVAVKGGWGTEGWAESVRLIPNLTCFLTS